MRMVAAILVAGLLVIGGCAETAGEAAGRPADIPSATVQASTAEEMLAPLRLRPSDGATADAATKAAGRYIQIFEAATRDPEHGVPDAAVAVVIGPALAQLIDQVNFMRHNKLVARGRSAVDLRYRGRESRRAYVTNCSPNGEVVVFHADSGKPAENLDPGFAVSLFEIRQDSTGWKVYQAHRFSEDRCPTRRSTA